MKEFIEMFPDQIYDAAVLTSFILYLRMISLMLKIIT